MNNIQKEFKDFCMDSQLFTHVSDIDYLGINISQAETRPVQFKLYYGNTYSQKDTHPLIKYLSSKDMIRYVTMVQDEHISGRKRFDIGLKNRSDANMKGLFDWLSENVTCFQTVEDEIKKISKLKVTKREGFQYAGLYFLGFISQEDEINVLKCHYFLRMCEDPDILHKNIQYMDAIYLDELAHFGQKEFALLSKCTARLLDVCGGHLWMAGTDYTENKPYKYKVYIKNPVDIYDGLMQVLSEMDVASDLVKYVHMVQKWQGEYQEFFCEGFAVCLTTDGVWSINFYNVISKDGVTA